MRNKILIAGAGQLGSRYLQGMKKVSLPLDIFIYDVSEDSLSMAKSRWEEIAENDIAHTVTFIHSLDTISEEFTIAIVSTTAAVRKNVIETILLTNSVHYWILEKVLAQDISDIETMEKLTRAAKGVWVNTPRRIMPWYDAIKQQLIPDQKITMNVTGGLWGIACNSMHFIDLMEWFTGESLQSVYTDGLSNKWTESKRKGYYEITGQLKTVYANKSEAFFTSIPYLTDMTLNIIQDNKQWVVQETTGKAYSSDGQCLEGRLNYQSELTEMMVMEIIESGTCMLPTLSQSASAHRIFLASLILHWNHSHDQKIIKLPIT